MNKEKERLTSEMRYLHTKKDRETNFENKAKISLKVERWYRSSQFSGEVVKEAEKIQSIINAIYSQAEYEDKKKFEVKIPEVIIEPRRKKELTGLGATNR